MISAVMIVKNGERYLKNCLDSLATFPEVVLVDTGSQDRTLDIAREFPNVRIFEKEFIGFGPTKNMAAELAEQDWILSVDCDEVLTPELNWDLAHLELEDNCIYRFPRQSFYNRKPIRGCGWYPDLIFRVYNRKQTAFNKNQVHESLVVGPGMRIIDLESLLKHYPYDNVRSLIDKAQFYSTLYAEQNQGRRASSPMKAFLHGMSAFVKSYLLRRGILEGYEGFVISASQGLASWLKYIKLYEMNRSHGFDD